MWATFCLCFKVIALIVFDISCSQNVNIFLFIRVGFNRNPARRDRTITQKTYVLGHNFVVLLVFVSDF